MNIEELEDLLKETKVEQQEPLKTPAHTPISLPRGFHNTDATTIRFSNISTGCTSTTIKVPYVRDSSVVDMLSFNYRSVCDLSIRIKQLPTEEKDMILRDVLKYVNHIAHGEPFTQDSLARIISLINTFIATYIYRWYPLIRAPIVRIKKEALSVQRSECHLSIIVDDLYLGTVGIRTSNGY
jgi:hypothetical protein